VTRSLLSLFSLFSLFSLVSLCVWPFLLVLASCRPSVDGTCVDADPRDLVPPTRGADLDRDGLADDFERALVRAHLPFLAHHPDDRCGRAGIVFRARPHPNDGDGDDGALVLVVASQLFAVDCGLNSHDGDNEAFAFTIDPSLPPPAGLTALVAISHQATACERTSSCGACPGMPACDRDADGRAILYSSLDKHAGAVDVGGACSFGSCLDSCALPLESADVPLVNAGEPDAPLLATLDVEDGGFIDAQWPEALRGYDPWGTAEFGGAGVVSEDLVDPAFTTPACTCAR
jgi:hypothetical protein